MNLILIVFSIVFCEFSYGVKLNYNYVTCGSVLKIKNSKFEHRLHSHEVKYGSGSGQQSVTAVDTSDDHNSYWQIRPRNGALQCVRGSPVKCSSTIRLQHLSTRRHLHSHQFASPLSSNQEVSAFGEESDIGDDGDNWQVVCKTQYWQRDSDVRLKHVVSGKYLHMTGDTYGRPIAGQKEVSAVSAQSDGGLWRAAEGVFIKPTEQPYWKAQSHEEL